MKTISQAEKERLARAREELGRDDRLRKRLADIDEALARKIAARRPPLPSVPAPREDRPS